MDQVQTVAAQFIKAGKVITAQPYGAGNVNDTFLVTVQAGTIEPAGATDNDQQRFILQRINTHVFHQPKLIVANMRCFADHVRQRMAQEPRNQRLRWEVPTVIATRDQQDFFEDDTGGFWRAISMIEGATTYQSILNADHARQAGYALGRFQSLISDLDTDLLYDTLPGFHITPQYLTQYDRIRAQGRQHPTSSARVIDVGHCFQFVEAHRKSATLLEDAQSAGRLNLRSIHGDPKVDNILIDDVTSEAISIIDLDTVKPGLVHYDIGDCLRSCCNLAGEETTDLNAVTFDTDLCQIILDGYFEEARHFFTKNDYIYLYDSIRLIAFELGLRFFTDYLAGNVYFKAKHAEHNLDRALVQFKVAASVEAQEAMIRKITDVIR